VIYWGGVGTANEGSSAGTVIQVPNGTSGTCSGMHQYRDDNPTNTLSDVYTVRVVVTDNGTTNGVSAPLSGNDELLATITNVAPVATIDGPPSSSIYPVGTTVTFTGHFTDVGTCDTHTATWKFDTTTVLGTVTESPCTTGNGTVTRAYTFTAPGVYDVTLTVTDDDGGVGSATTVGGPSGLPARVIIYDPSAGFVTGGGYILQPASGAFPAGGVGTKSNYGFVAKYKNGAIVPTGEFEFQFKPGDINFHGSTYDWLVVTTLSNGYQRAQAQGTGTINGTGTYKFLATVIDGGGNDTFRIRIWNSSGVVIYDNEDGRLDSTNPTTPAIGGNLVIHK
jgi:hypothetical protein